MTHLLLALLFGGTIRDLSNPYWPAREDASATLRQYPVVAFLVDGDTPEAERRLEDVRESTWAWRVRLWAAAEKHLGDEFVMGKRADIVAYAQRYGPSSVPFPGDHTLMRDTLSRTMYQAPWYANGTEAGDFRHLLKEALKWDTRSSPENRGTKTTR